MRKGVSFFVIAMLCASISFIIFANIYMFDSLEYKQSFAYIPHEEYVEPQLSNDEAIELINKLNNKTFKVEFVENTDYDGQVTLFALFDNTIRINKEILDNPCRFVWAYAHETIHATRFCLDERKTQYLTFVLLYESENEYFKQVALNQASNMINNIYKEYDATYYIAEYLNNK